MFWKTWKSLEDAPLQMNSSIIKLQSHTFDIVFTLIVNTIVELEGGCFSLNLSLID